MLQRRCRPERVVSHLVIVHKLWEKILQRHTTIKWHYESQPIQCNAKMTQISQRDPKWYDTNSQQFRHSHFPGKSQGHDVCFRFQKAKSWLVNQWTRNCLKWCGRTGKSRRDSNRSDAHRYPGPSWDRAVSVPLLQTTPAELTLLIWFDSAGKSQFDRQFLLCFYQSSIFTTLKITRIWSQAALRTSP
jgi:hypothetical protein